MNRTAFMALTIGLYLVAMAAVSWVAWQIVPGAVGWLSSQIGETAMGAIVIAGPFLLWGLGYYLGRKPSGTNLEP